jgi:Tfp pilus assembly protein PilZ
MDSGETELQIRRLVVRFATLEAFQAEYRRNIGNGGIFVETAEEFELREVVGVVLDLVFSDAVVQLDGEVVQCVRPELSRAGGTPGVAVQFLEPAEEVRRRLGSLAALPPAPAFQGTPERPRETRAAERSRARIAARVAAKHETRRARTSNLSASGALVSLKGTPLPQGTSVRVALVHPTTGEELTLRGTVVRHEPEPAGSTAHGIRFDDSYPGDDSLRSFVESVRRADHARRLAAITGPIETVGLPNLLQMFSSSTERGMLMVARGSEEGLIAFESGSLTLARLGRVRGTKALARMFAWPAATFEFHTRPDDLPDDARSDEPTPMYGAVMEAVAQLDERNRIDRSRLPGAMRLVVNRERVAPDDDALAKVESAILDLLGAEGASVAALLDALPQPDHEILRALLALLDAGTVVPLK